MITAADAATSYPPTDIFYIFANNEPANLENMKAENKCNCRFASALFSVLCIVSACGTTSSLSSGMEDGIYYRRDAGTSSERTSTFTTIEKKRDEEVDPRITRLAEKTILINEAKKADKYVIKHNGTLKKDIPTYSYGYGYGYPYWGNCYPYWGVGFHFWYHDPWYWDPWYRDVWYWNAWSYGPWGPWGPWGPYYPCGPWGPYYPWVPAPVPVYHNTRGYYAGMRDAVGGGTVRGGYYGGISGSRDEYVAYTRGYSGGGSSSGGGAPQQTYRRPEGLPSGGYSRDASYSSYSRSGYTDGSSAQGGTYGRSGGYESSYTRSSGYSGGGYSGGGYSGGGSYGRSGSGGYGGGGGSR